MLINKEKNRNQLELILDKIARDLQLNKERLERMKSAYTGVSECIMNDKEFFKDVKFEIYPQGSVLIGTTVKPLKGDEYDLDIVIHLEIDWNNPSLNPLKVYDELKKVLTSSNIYKDKVDPKNRVIRINYSGDFHMDIMPGVQETIGEKKKIRIPDTEKKQWKSSNPKGFAEWFESKCIIMERSLLEGLYSKAEPLPDQERYEAIPPLKRAVQLIKRYRDIYFQDDDEFKVSSIIITTLAGHLYRGDNSIVDSIKNIANDIHLKFSQFQDNYFEIQNPTNNDEKFTDKWKDDARYYKNFKKFIIDLKKYWDKVENYQEIMENKEMLSGLFGENNVNEAFSFNEKIQTFEAQKISKAMSEGILTLSTPNSQKKYQVTDRGGFHGKI